jgi:drug/metabolite transporter (DMT)-like permease
VLVSAPALAAQEWAGVSGGAWAGLVASALGALVIAYLIWFRGVERLGPSRTAMYSNFTPVVVALSAWPLLGEVPTLWQAAGAAGIFGGIVLTRT